MISLWLLACVAIGKLLRYRQEKGMTYSYVTRASALRFWNPDGSRKPGLVLGEEHWEYLGTPVLVHVTGRSLAGSGEVRLVGTMFLNTEPEPNIPYGTPIGEGDVVPFKGELR